MLFDLKKADIIGQHPDYSYQIDELNVLYNTVKNIINNKTNISIC